MSKATVIRRTQAERSATAHRRMLRAAVGLIAQQGYSKTSLAQVGKEAGYSGGLVSHHFGSKEGLLRELVAHLAHRFYRDQVEPAISGASGFDALDATVDTYLGELRERPERMRALYVLMGEALGPLSEVRDVFADLNRDVRVLVRGWLERGVADGAFRRDLDVDAEAAAIVASVRGIASQWIADPGCIDLDASATCIKRAMRSTLAAEATEAL